MSVDDDIDGLAAEYVLGTLDTIERAGVEARLRREPALAAAVARWETRLQPLAEGAGEAAPPAGGFDRILATIDRRAGVADLSPRTAANDNLAGLRRSLVRWRISAAALGALAAVLAGWLFVRLALYPQAGEFVALLSADGADPAFVATVDMRDGRLTIRRIAGEPAPANHAYELWAIAPESAPRSLGLVQNAVYSAPIGGFADGPLTLAISVEPAGGAPGDGPTGPVVFQGRLLAAD